MGVLLSKTERDCLLGNREFTKEYYIISRLLKKIKTLYETELPLLAEKGYLAAKSKNLLQLIARHYRSLITPK
jgi:hypothetical protein